MNKKDFISTVSKKSGLTQRDAEVALNTITDCLTHLLAKGDSIVLPGFASFSVKKRAARKGRNPATGKEITIAAHKAISFKTGSKLKEAINK